LLEDDWWSAFPACDVRQVLPVLRTVAQHARPAEELWHTAWERELTPDECGADELDQLRRSVLYLHSIGAIQ
jgi:hypothetical protein